MEILKRTRELNNINLLKARDMSYEYARRLNWMVISLAILPIVYSIISNITGFKLSELLHIGINEKFIGVLLTGVIYAATLLISERIRKWKELSNEFREMYDCHVFDMPANKHMTKVRTQTEIDRLSKKAKDYELYPVWYGETFSGDHFTDVILCQADNISYAAFLYRRLNNLLKKQIYLIIVVLVIIMIVLGDFEKMFFEVLIPSFTIFTLIFKVTHKSRLIQQDYKVILNRLQEDALANRVDQLYIRMLQDRIFLTRSNDIITPMFIRKNLLGDTNEYKEFLHQFKEAVYRGKSKKPETPNEIPLYSLEFEDKYTMADLQDRLLKMVSSVDEICNANNIPYVIDGGTLIGAVRHKGFIPWDDDIDLAIMYKDKDAFYQTLKAHLPSEFTIQCFENDPAYSPVLPKFRIRMKGTEVLEEIPNASTNFKEKGIFIDVYTFDYALKPIILDKMYRLLIILPVYKVLTFLDVKSKGRLQLIRLKKLFLQLEALYSKLPKNKKWISYSPTYLYRPLQPGPYYESEKVFTNRTKLSFAGRSLQAPDDPNHVLTQCYGPTYMTPNKAYVTVLQHIKAVKL